MRLSSLRPFASHFDLVVANPQVDLGSSFRHIVVRMCFSGQSSQTNPECSMVQPSAHSRGRGQRSSCRGDIGGAVKGPTQKSSRYLCKNGRYDFSAMDPDPAQSYSWAIQYMLVAVCVEVPQSMCAPKS